MPPLEKLGIEPSLEQYIRVAEPDPDGLNLAITEYAAEAAEDDFWALTPEALDELANANLDELAAVNIELNELFALAGYGDDAHTPLSDYHRATADSSSEHIADLVDVSTSDDLPLRTTAEFCPIANIRSGLVVNGADHVVGRIDFVGGCGRWKCGVCGPRKRWKLVRRIALGEPNRFLTLTTEPRDAETPRECFKRTSPKVGELFRSLKKRFGAISYARILESTKRGFPHYHFCVRSNFLDQRFIASEWMRLTGACVVDIRVLKGKTVNYVAKYVTKHDHVMYTRQRVSFSRNWPKFEREPRDVDLAEWTTTHNEDLPTYASRLQAECRSRDLGPNSIGLTITHSESNLVNALAEQFGTRPHSNAPTQPRDYVLNPPETR